jgi:hypothetical protein
MPIRQRLCIGCGRPIVSHSHYCGPCSPGSRERYRDRLVAARDLVCFYCGSDRDLVAVVANEAADPRIAGPDYCVTACRGCRS